MQHPPQQQQFVPVYMPYFNQARVAPQQQQQMEYGQQQAPLLYSEAPQQAVYPQVPLVEQQVPQQAAEQAPAQQHSCPFSRAAACGRGRCCKKIDARNALAVFGLAPIFAYVFVYFSALFSYMIRNSSGSSFFYLVMSITAAVMAITGAKKSNVVVLGIFIGMTSFSAVAGFVGFLGALFNMFNSVLSFAVFVAELIAGFAKIAGIIAAAKLIKKIKMETSLPQFIEQQAEQQQAQEQQIHEETAPVVAPIAVQPVQVQPQVVAAPMYPQWQQFQAPIIAQAPQQQAPQQFATEVQLLKDMGFSDVEKNVRLLQKHNGSLQAVVMEYVQA